MKTYLQSILLLRLQVRYMQSFLIFLLFVVRAAKKISFLLKIYLELRSTIPPAGTVSDFATLHPTAMRLKLHTHDFSLLDLLEDVEYLSPSDQLVFHHQVNELSIY